MEFYKQCIGMKFLMISIVCNALGLRCLSSSCAMHLDCNAYDMHNCAMQSKNKQCIGIKLLMISIVVQCKRNE